MTNDAPINENIILKYNQTIKTKVFTQNLPNELLKISLFETNTDGNEDYKVAEVSKRTNEKGFLWCEFKLPLDFPKMTNAMMNGNQDELHEYYVLVEAETVIEADKKIEEVTVKGKYKKQLEQIHFQKLAEV